MPKINYETVEKSAILSKVVSLKKTGSDTVRVKYDRSSLTDYVKMDYANELSEKYGIAIG